MSATTPRLLDDLQRPEAYPLPRPAHVTLVTTHISWVFLTDHEVWKLKRPVDYGFLDYTSVERRRHFCEEEVRLNRRLAPDVYRGVVPLRVHGGHHSFRGGGPIVDHAVRMRRLPADASADALLGRRRLTHEHLERLAARLARFYATAASAPTGDPLEPIRLNVTENLDQARPFIGRFVPLATFEAAQDWQLDWLERQADRFRARAAAGRTREGHGDLRLEHVYFESEAGEPLVIDAIEFNERFRTGDVAADVTFLAMELDARAEPALAAGFLARFAMESNDYDLYTVADFYLCYRACVRAKVAGFLATDPSTPPDKAARKSAEAEALFALAESYTAGPVRPGPVLAIGGLTGTGKSTLAGALGRALGLPVIASDRTRKHLAGIAPTQRAPDEAYAPAWSRRTFDEVFRRAGAVLGSGRGVILDTTFRSRELRLRARELARRHARPFRFVETTCDEATLRERLRGRARGPSVSDATEALLDRVRAEFEAVTELPPAEHVVLSTTEPLEAQVAVVRRALAG
jgi:uncharacterized protein